MKTHLEPEAPNTINFVKHLVSELLKREPLKHGKTIIIQVGEDSPYFPEFTDNILEGNQDLKPDDVVEERGVLAVHKLMAIREYLEDKFKFHTAVLWPKDINLDPLALDIPLIVIDPNGLYKMAKELEVKSNYKNPESTIDNSEQATILATIYYNTKTGLGYANGKRFRIKNNQPDFRVFNAMWRKIGTPIPRVEILKLAGQTDIISPDLNSLTQNTSRKSSEHNSATYFINNLAKKMRKITGLNIDNICLNNGSLTLVGKKIRVAPK